MRTSPSPSRLPGDRYLKEVPRPSGARRLPGAGRLPAARRLLGQACVAVLKALRAVPARLAETALRPLLSAYPALRPSQARRLRSLFAASPFAGRLTMAAYYRRRLSLMLRGLALHGRPLAGLRLAVEGEEHYRSALASGRPVALLGLHMGLLEILHRVPEAPPGRPFRILTAPAFAPALTRYLAWGRERDGKRILGIGGAAAGLRRIAASGGVLAFMADQVPGRPEACLRLWGRIEMPYPARLLAFLARRGFRILPVATWQAEDGVTAFRYHAPWPEVADAEAALRAFLESAIAEAPDQWNWSYGKLRVSGPL